MVNMVCSGYDYDLDDGSLLSRCEENIRGLNSWREIDHLGRKMMHGVGISIGQGPDSDPILYSIGITLPTPYFSDYL